MKKILRYLRSSLGYLYVCFKWVILAALVGCVVGPFGAMFGLALNKATALRTADPRLIYLLPLGGLVIVFLYQHFDPDGGGSTNQIFVAVREHKPLSLRTAPLIFVTTIITHLFGGSSGREGAALQIGGGIGVPPMLEAAKHYDRPTAILGFRTASAAILEEDFAACGADVITCTDDGSKGLHGFVTDALQRYLEEHKPALICACGPKPMLQGIVDLAKQHGIPCEVSLEERMACGVGACLVCACKTVKNGETFSAHVYKDGPVFKAEEVVL